MGLHQDTSIEPAPSVVLGPCRLCGKDNVYSLSRMKQYQDRCFVISSLCKYCIAWRRGLTKPLVAPERLDAKAMATAIQDAETTAEAAPKAAPKAEEAVRVAVARTAEASLKVEEQEAPAKAVKDAKDAATMAAPLPNADEVEKTAAIKTADACLKAAEQEVLLVKDAEEAPEAARKAEEE